MRRTTALKYAVAGTALAALSIGGASAFADTDGSEDPVSAPVVNKNGHEVDEHAAGGQARAAEARAQRLEKAAERAAEEPEVEEPEVVEPEVEEPQTELEETETETEPAGPPADHTDNGNHGGPDEHAGDHPNENAFEHPQAHQPNGPKDGHGPNEHAGDHPNENATNGPGNSGHGPK